jgi:lysine 2,3-aminomutase
MTRLNTPAALQAEGLVTPQAREALEAVARRYAVAITPHMAAMMEKGFPEDPIARQFVPHPDELVTTPEERADPIGDAAHAAAQGIVHRYKDRVLWKIHHACPVYCRFCFRREMVGPGKAHALKPAEFAAGLAYIASRPEIWEVILTGGDPFLLSPARARTIGQGLAGLEHVEVVRWHTRAPVVAPERVTPAFIRALKAFGRAVYVAVHVNHPRELAPEALRALARMADAGLPLLSQTVLLRGVNDDPDTLELLMRRLVAARVKPYYLHHGDLAPGTGHFRTTIAEGQALVRELKVRASGLCQPTYVLDIPGGFGKAALTPAHVRTCPHTEVLGDDGVWRAYPPGPADPMPPS